MALKVHPRGLGESLGADLINEGPLVHTGKVWWVNSATGANAVAPRGTERLRPLATLAQAVSNASAGDLIVLMDGHTETISAASPLDITKQLTIVGSGQSAGKPTVKIGLSNAAAASNITISADYVIIRNVWLEAKQTANAQAAVRVTGSVATFRDCYFECGALDTGFKLRFDSGSDDCTVRGCTFVSTATVIGTTPAAAISHRGTTLSLTIEDTTFDGGTVGFTDGYAVDNDGASQNVGVLRGENITLLRGADIRVTSGTVGYIHTNVGSYAPRLDWDGTAAG